MYQGDVFTLILHHFCMAIFSFCPSNYCLAVIQQIADWVLTKDMLYHWSLIISLISYYIIDLLLYHWSLIIPLISDYTINRCRKWAKRTLGVILVTCVWNFPMLSDLQTCFTGKPSAQTKMGFWVFKEASPTYPLNYLLILK